MSIALPPLPAAGEPALVLFLQGIPGSGKSTFAAQVMAANPPGSVARINNDDLSSMLFGSPWQSGGAHGARLLAKARVSLLRSLLREPGVRLILVDNTNLSPSSVSDLAEEAWRAGARVDLEDAFLRVPVEDCLARDAARERSVGGKVIRDMHARALRDAPKVRARLERGSDHAMVEAPYSNDPDLPETVIVDVDGTLALMNGRGPFEWHRVGEDLPNMPVVNFVRDLLAAGRHVTILSGRDGVCFEQTRAWLDEHVAPGLPLLMRAPGDQRKDSQVKHELFLAHIAGQRRVVLVLDDRDQVVHLWRRQLGLPTWQVADGDF